MTEKSPLRLERERRGWSQSRLAELLETTPISISRWEQGNVLPSLYFREKICALFKKDAQALRLLRQTEEPQSASFALYDPLLPNQALPSSGLIGREALLHTLTQQVCATPRAATFILHGLPGVGKTTLLLALTRNPAIQQHFPDGILWVGMGPHPHIFEQLSRWGNLLQIPQEKMKSLQDHFSLAKALRSHIGSRRLLLILDDVWQAEDALALQVGGVNCTHLMTTRFPGLTTGPGIQKHIHISELEASEGKALLTHFLPHLAEQQPAVIEQLVREVGMLPLALTLIGKHLYPYDYMKQPRRLQTALEQLRDRSALLHIRQPQSFVEHHPSLPPEQSISLEAVIAVSAQQLSSLAQQALRHLAVLPAKPNSISKELISALIPKTEEILTNLLDTGLVECYEIGRYALHQTIADYARSTMLKDDERQAVWQRLMNYALSWLKQHTEDREGIEEEYSNLMSIVEISRNQGQKATFVELVLSFVPFWKTQGWYKQAENYLQQAIQAAQNFDDRFAEIGLLKHLGEMAEGQGNYTQARTCYQEGLQRTGQENNKEQSIPFLHGLSTIEIRQGNYEQAEKYCLAGLELAQKGENQGQLGPLLYNQGLLRHYKSHYSQAELSYQEALTLAQQSGQRELISRIWNGLGAAAERQGKNDKAEAYYLEGLQLAKQMGHQENIVRLFNGLGVLANRKRDRDQAITYYQEALVIARKIGQQSLICNILYNLAEVSRKQGRTDQARASYQEALTLAQQIGYKRIIAAARVGLGKILLEQQQLEQARITLHEALQDTDLDSDIKAHTLYALARVEEAHDQLEQALIYGKDSLTLFKHIKHYKAERLEKWIKEIEHSVDNQGGSHPWPS